MGFRGLRRRVRAFAYGPGSVAKLPRAVVAALSFSHNTRTNVSGAGHKPLTPNMIPWEEYTCLFEL